MLQQRLPRELLPQGSPSQVLVLRAFCLGVGKETRPGGGWRWREPGRVADSGLAGPG